MSGSHPIDVESMYRRYAPMVLRRCRHLLDDEEDALEAMQETFVRMLEHADRLDNRAPSSLLWTTATRVSLNRIRAQGSRPTRGAAQELVDRIAVAPLEGQLFARRVLDKLFGRHDDTARAVAVMHHVDGMTHAQVAEVVGLSVSGVRFKLRQLKSTLQELEDE